MLINLTAGPPLPRGLVGNRCIETAFTWKEVHHNVLRSGASYKTKQKMLLCTSDQKKGIASEKTSDTEVWTGALNWLQWTVNTMTPKAS